MLDLKNKTTLAWSKDDLIELPELFQRIPEVKEFREAEGNSWKPLLLHLLRFRATHEAAEAPHPDEALQAEIERLKNALLVEQNELKTVNERFTGQLKKEKDSLLAVNQGIQQKLQAAQLAEKQLSAMVNQIKKELADERAKGLLAKQALKERITAIFGEGGSKDYLADRIKKLFEE